jgi:5-methylthioadenosine/S-adenosylhomocysteine deaminase
MSTVSLVGGKISTFDVRRRVLDVGTVVIEDGTIVAVLAGTHNVGEVLDCRGKFIFPGLVNTHAHTAEVVWRGLGGGLPTKEWAQTRKHPLMAQLDEDSAEIAVRLACSEMLRSGTTAFLDPEIPLGLLPGIARAARASGMRAGLAVTMPSGHGYGQANGPLQVEGHSDVGHQRSRHSRSEDVVLSSERIGAEIENWRRDGRVSMWLALRVLSGADEHSASTVRSLASERHLRVTYHAAENREDVDAIHNQTGLGPAAYAQSLGLLGEDVVIAHGVQVTRDDMTLLAATRTAVAHCPSSNARTGSGIAPLPAYLEHGVVVGLGTDGGMVNDTYDLISEMRTAAIIHNASNGSGTCLVPEQLLQMATVNGARMLGIGSGAIEVGAAADAIVIDLHRLGSWPVHDVFDSLVYSADRNCVSDVVIGGDVLLRNGSLVDVDEDVLLSQASEIATETIRAAGIVHAKE